MPRNSRTSHRSKWSATDPIGTIDFTKRNISITEASQSINFSIASANLLLRKMDRDNANVQRLMATGVEADRLDHV